MKCHVQCLLVLLLLADMASAATITVRKDGTGDFMVLQQALNVAADGDSILIGPGEFTEMPWVRIPGYSWDIRSCGYITANDLTIVGAGVDQTLIGPTSYSVNNSLYSPKAIVYAGGGALSLNDLTVRNCYDGIFARATLFLSGCAIENNYEGIFLEAVGSESVVRNTAIAASTPQYPMAATIMPFGAGAGVLLEHCRVEGAEMIISGVPNATFIDCQFVDDIVGISIYDNARVYLRQSTIANMSAYGIQFSLGSGGYCEISESEVSGDISALDTGGSASGGRFVVYGSRLTGGTTAVLRARYRPGPCVINACDLIKGSGPIVQCGPSYTTVTHDMTNNYWGTTNEAEIQAWIIDRNDSASIPATVLYAPFDGQSVPTKSTSWGELKALFR